MAGCRDELRPPAFDDAAHRLVRLGIGLGSGDPARRLRPSDGEAFQRVPLVADIDDAPVGEVLRQQPCDPLDRALVVERRQRQVANPTEEVEPSLPLCGGTDSRSLSGKCAIAFLVGPLSLPDVDEEAAPVERSPVRPAKRRPLLANPDNPSVAGEQPVLRVDRRSAPHSVLDLDQHALAVLRVQQSREEVRFSLPLVGRVSEHRLDLRADEPRRAAIAGLVRPRHERNALDEGSKALLTLVRLLDEPQPLHEPLALRPVEAIRDESCCERRRQRDRHRELEALRLGRQEQEGHRDRSRQHETDDCRQPRARAERSHLYDRAMPGSLTAPPAAHNPARTYHRVGPQHMAEMVWIPPV